MSVQNTTTVPPIFKRAPFRTVGIGFIVLGVLAMLAPVIATLVVEQLVAWLLVIWGIGGFMFAYSFREVSEWKFMAAGFAAVLAIGLWFVFFPEAGAAFMTGFLIFTFLLEGALSILLGLRLSGQLANWRWVVGSGVCAVILGIIILAQWPETAQWVIGFLTGLNFLSTGLTLLLISRATHVNSRG